MELHIPQVASLLDEAGVTNDHAALVIFMSGASSSTRFALAPIQGAASIIHLFAPCPR